MTKSKAVLGLVAGVGLAVSGLAASPAMAAPQSQPLNCAGQQLTVRVSDNHSSDHGGWGAGVIVEGGSGVLVPTSFAGSAYDVTADQPMFSFSQDKGNGNGNRNLQTVTCSDVQTMLLSDFVQPGDQLPPWASLTDTITFTLTVTAAVRS
jgi:hypothetical protein